MRYIYLAVTAVMAGLSVAATTLPDKAMFVGLAIWSLGFFIDDLDK